MNNAVEIIDMKCSIDARRSELKTLIGALHASVTRVSADTIPLLQQSFTKAMDDIKTIVDRLSMELYTAIESTKKLPSLFYSTAETLQTQLNQKQSATATAVHALAVKAAEVAMDKSVADQKKQPELASLQQQASRMLQSEDEHIQQAKKEVYNCALSISKEIQDTLSSYNRVAIGILQANSTLLHGKQ